LRERPLSVVPFTVEFIGLEVGGPISFDVVSPALSASVFLFAGGSGTVRSQFSGLFLSLQCDLRVGSLCFLLNVPGGAIMLAGLTLFVADGSSVRALSGEGARPGCGRCDMNVLKLSVCNCLFRGWCGFRVPYSRSSPSAPSRSFREVSRPCLSIK
jgi:hypothetical protein